MVADDLRRLSITVRTLLSVDLSALSTVEAIHEVVVPTRHIILRRTNVNDDFLTTSPLYIIEDTLASIDAVIQADSLAAMSMEPETRTAEIIQISRYDEQRRSPVAAELARRRAEDAA